MQKAIKSGSAPFILGFQLISPLPTVHCTGNIVEKAQPKEKQLKSVRGGPNSNQKKFYESFSCFNMDIFQESRGGGTKFFLQFLL